MLLAKLTIGPAPIRVSDLSRLKKEMETFKDALGAEIDDEPPAYERFKEEMERHFTELQLLLNSFEASTVSASRFDRSAKRKWDRTASAVLASQITYRVTLSLPKYNFPE